MLNCFGFGNVGLIKEKVRITALIQKSSILKNSFGDYFLDSTVSEIEIFFFLFRTLSQHRDCFSKLLKLFSF